MNAQAEQKKHEIIVNGRPQKVEQDELSYDQVVGFAFNPVPSGPNVVITVAWRHGNEGGTLVEGQSVAVKDGMKFDVTATDKS